MDAEVISGDGLDPKVGDEPFDRIHVTCGIREVPNAWLKLCPTGRITMPWTNSFARNADYVITLVRNEDRAVGRFLHPCAFMTARAQRLGPFDEWPDTGEAHEADLAVPWSQLNAPPARSAAFVVGLLLPGMEHRTSGTDDPSQGERILWLARDGRYASLAFGKDVPTTVAGDEELIDDYVRAARWWHEHGTPEAGEFGLTVTSGNGRYAETQVWFRTPTSPLNHP